MKSIRTVGLILICATLIVSCKKKETESADTTQTGSTTTTGLSPVIHINKLTAKVNGQDWSMTTTQFGPLIYLEKDGSKRGFGGQMGNNNPISTIKLNFKCQTGTFLIIPGGNFEARYTHSGSFNVFSAETGTINITEWDTSKVKSDYLHKFKCTFSFTTDTINNESYNITNGVADYEAE